MGWFTAAGSLGIELSTPVVYSGGNIQGNVIAIINKNIEAKTCQISLKGEEFADVHWTTGSDHNKTARRQIVGIDLPLTDFSAGRVSPGRYVWPFTAVVPTGLPSTMYASGGGGHCKITYSLKARLARPGIFSFDIKAGCNLQVASTPLPPAPVPVFVQPDSKKVKLCCCIDRGSMTLGATADDTLVGRGQTISIGMACKNDSSTEIQGIDCQIMEHVVWRAGGHSNKSRRPIAVAEFQASDVAGVEKLTKEQLEAVKADAKEGGNDRAETYQELFNQLVSGQQRRQMTCARDARDTYSGQVITCSHRMFVRLTTACGINNPAVELPIRIGTPPLPQPSDGPVRAEVVAVGRLVPEGTAPPTMVFAEGAPTSNDNGGLTQRPADWDSGPPVVMGTVVALPMDSAVIGGNATEADGEGEGGKDDLPVVVAAPVFVTLQGLLNEMDRTLDGLTLLRVKAGDPTWSGVLGALSPDQYANIVGKVNVETDQPQVAMLLASKIAASMTCAHLAAALARSSDIYRGTMVELTAALCTDLKENARLIHQQLSFWQQVTTRAKLEELGVDVNAL